MEAAAAAKTTQNDATNTKLEQPTASPFEQMSNLAVENQSSGQSLTQIKQSTDTLVSKGTLAPMTLSDNGSDAKVSPAGEAQKLETMLKTFLGSNDTSTEQSTLNAYQKELGNYFAANGESQTKAVISQIGKDMKSVDGLNVMQNISNDDNGDFYIVNKNVAAGNLQSTPTTIMTELNGNSIETIGGNGAGDYGDTSWNLSTNVAKGAASTKDSSHIANPVSNNGGGYSGSDSSGGSTAGRSNGLSVGQSVVIQNNDGSTNYGMVVGG